MTVKSGTRLFEARLSRALSISLHVLNGRTYGEVVECMGITKSGVSKWLHDNHLSVLRTALRYNTYDVRAYSAETERRVRAVAAGRAKVPPVHYNRIAASLGLSPPGLLMWMRRHASEHDEIRHLVTERQRSVHARKRVKALIEDRKDRPDWRLVRLLKARQLVQDGHCTLDASAMLGLSGNGIGNMLYVRKKTSAYWALNEVISDMWAEYRPDTPEPPEYAREPMVTADIADNGHARTRRAWHRQRWLKQLDREQHAA